MFTDAGAAYEFVTAGRAIITLTSQKTEARYTYRISQSRNRETNQLENKWFVALLTGPNNEADYQYIGMLDAIAGTLQFRLTRASKLGADSIPVRAFCFFWKFISLRTMPPQMEIRHEGRCGRCGRTLTVPESIDRGIGPECASIMGRAA